MPIPAVIKNLNKLAENEGCIYFAIPPRLGNGKCKALGQIKKKCAYSSNGPDMLCKLSKEYELKNEGEKDMIEDFAALRLNDWHNEIIDEMKNCHEPTPGKHCKSIGHLEYIKQRLIFDKSENCPHINSESICMKDYEGCLYLKDSKCTANTPDLKECMYLSTDKTCKLSKNYKSNKGNNMNGTKFFSNDNQASASCEETLKSIVTLKLAFMEFQTDIFSRSRELPDGGEEFIEVTTNDIKKIEATKAIVETAITVLGLDYDTEYKQPRGALKGV